MNEYLFSYGTLQRDEVQIRLFGRFLTGKRDILRGYKTTTIEIADASFLSKGEQRQQQTLIISNDNAEALAGTVFELSKEELLQADKYEPAGYERHIVKLQSGIQAWVYSVK